MWWPKISPHRIQRDLHESGKFAIIPKLMQNEKSEPGLAACLSRPVRCDSFLNESCSAMMQNIANWRSALPILCANTKHLSAPIITAGWANRMRRHGAAALRAVPELRRMPAIRWFACAQSHRRGLTFWDDHRSGLRKQRKPKKQIARRSYPVLQLPQRRRQNL